MADIRVEKVLQDLPEDADILSTSDFLYAGPVGSREEWVVMYRLQRGLHRVVAGCWEGSLDALEARVTDMPADWIGAEAETAQRWRGEYLGFIAMARLRATRWKEGWEAQFAHEANEERGYFAPESHDIG